MQHTQNIGFHQVMIRNIEVILLSTKPTKWLNALKNYSNLFDHFAGLALKRLQSDNILVCELNAGKLGQLPFISDIEPV